MTRQPDSPESAATSGVRSSHRSLGAWKPRLSVSVVIPAHQAASPRCPTASPASPPRPTPPSCSRSSSSTTAATPPVVLPELRPENTQRAAHLGVLGPRARLRRGRRFAEGDVIHWLDADMLLHHDEVEAQLRWHHLVDHAVVLGPQAVRRPLRGTRRRARRSTRTSGPAARASCSTAAGRPGTTGSRSSSAKHDDLNAAAFHAYLVHVGASASLRRDFYQTSGGMDSDLKLGEDVELGYRLAQRGALFVPDREARSWHLGRSTLMLRQEEVNRYNRPFVTDRITDLRHWRSKGRATPSRGSGRRGHPRCVLRGRRPHRRRAADRQRGRPRGRAARRLDRHRATSAVRRWRTPTSSPHAPRGVRRRAARPVPQGGRATAFPSAWRLVAPAGWSPSRDSSAGSPGRPTARSAA